MTTVEGLASAEDLHPLQVAFAEEGAAQCGYCTPGMLMTAKALLDTTARPTRAQIASAISGNLCRCTGYTAIYEAIEKAAASEGGAGASLRAQGPLPLPLRKAGGTNATGAQLP